MASVNRVILVGNLGRDPEIRYAPDGAAIANLALATTDQWKDKSGEKQERTEWHRVVAFGRQAEVLGEHAKKGASLYVEGSLATRKWTDQEGKERYTTEIRLSSFQFLGSRQDGGGQRREEPQRERSQQQQRKEQKAADFEDFANDLPF